MLAKPRKTSEHNTGRSRSSRAVFSPSCDDCAVSLERYITHPEQNGTQPDHMLASIYSTMPCGVIRFLRKDGLYRLLSINPAAIKLLGFTSDNVYSVDWSAGVAPTVLPMDTWPILDAYGKLNQVGDVQRVDYYCVRRPDDTLCFLTNEVALLSEDENGQIIQRLLYDITDRVRLEEQLRQEQTRYRDALLHGCHQAYTFDVNEGVIYSLQKDDGSSLSPVTLPMHYDTLIPWLIEYHNAVIISGSLEENTTAGYLSAYQRGIRLIELEYYVPSMDLYQRKSTFLSRDNVTGHVLACIVIREVTQMRKKELFTQRALIKLAETAEQIMQGNLDVTFDTSMGGDVGALAQVFQRTVAELKARIEHINELAHTDALSSMRNKRAYIRAVNEINNTMVQNPDAVFGVVMFDLNDLKQVNDTYGHEHGDQYIQTAASHIQTAFEGVTVYRIGGDEFVAILDAHALPLMDDLVETLQRSIADYNAAHPELPYNISIALGCAAYDKQLDQCFLDTYRRADRLMYQDKRKGKDIQ